MSIIIGWYIVTTLIAGGMAGGIELQKWEEKQRSKLAIKIEQASPAQQQESVGNQSSDAHGNKL